MYAASAFKTDQSAPAVPMTRWQRRAVVTMFVILAALFNMTIAPRPKAFFAGWWPSGEAFVAGSLFAQISILATWGGLGCQPLMARVPLAIGTGAFLGLSLVWGLSRERFQAGSSLLPAIVVLLLVVTQMLALFLVRRYGTWQVGATNDYSRSVHARFGSRSLLLWTTGVALLLAMGRWASPERDVTFASLADMLVILLITVPVATARVHSRLVDLKTL
jgi:hypothetical protein